MARPSKIGEATSWLKIYVSGGRRPANDIYRAGSMQNPAFKRDTLRKAKDILKLETERIGYNPAVWFWSNPIAEETETKDEKGPTVRELQAEIRQGIIEAARLAAPPKSATATEYGKYGSSSGRPINYDDPEEVARMKSEAEARAEAMERAQQRLKVIEATVTSSDPFGLLESANSEETEEMLTIVRNHHFELGGKTATPESTAEIAKWAAWIIKAKIHLKEVRNGTTNS